MLEPVDYQSYCTCHDLSLCNLQLERQRNNYVEITGNINNVLFSGMEIKYGENGIFETRLL